MRRFAYNELGEDEPVVITEVEILDQYYAYWSREMLKHGGLSPKITEANCLDDFLDVHWAWELTMGSRQFEHLRRKTLASLQQLVPHDCPLMVRLGDTQGFTVMTSNGEIEVTNKRAEVIASWILGYVTAWAAGSARRRSPCCDAPVTAEGPCDLGCCERWRCASCQQTWLLSLNERQVFTDTPESHRAP